MSEPAAVPHPDWPVWQCELESPEVAEAQQWTVGDKKILKCEGSSIETLKDPIRFAFPAEELSYTLHNLEILKIDRNSLEMVVTSYKPGTFSSPWIEVQGADSGFRFENFQWQVGTVIQQGGAPPQPILHVDALGMKYPLWMWAGLVVALLIPAIFIILKVRRRTQINRLVESLAQSNTALKPYDHFSKEVRTLVREYNYHRDNSVTSEFIIKLNSSFKAFLTRELRLPAHEWRVGQLVSEMRKLKRGLYKEITPQVRNLMHELNKAEKASQPTVEDADQLKKLTMSVADKVYRLPEERAKK